MPPFVIRSLRGGLNDADPPIALADDQVTVAQNVEFHRSMLGERRRGGTAIDLTGSDLEGCDRIVWIHRHLPTTDDADAQLWALGIDGSSAVLAYKDTSWHTVSVSDAFTVDTVSEYQVRGLTLHGKLFIAYNSSVDRLHVWDGTSFRRVGLGTPANAPTGANAGSGTFASTRYYRVRWAIQASGATVLRSEPSARLSFAPSGSGASVTVTRPTTTGEDTGITHWEIEASLNDADWYRMATIAIATTTHSDTVVATDGYAATGTVSPTAGDYTVPHSAKVLVADEDRMLLFGAWEDTDLASSASWTPVHNATGVGNDERIPLDPVSVVNLDGFEGGPITDASQAVLGEIWVFKQSHTYRLQRAFTRTRAYEAFCESKQRGAIFGSVLEAFDEAGQSVVYALDPAVGPMRARRTGLQTCGRDVRDTWESVNLDATKAVARSLYYPAAMQALWCVATDDANVPDVGLTLQTNEQRTTETGEARRGWSTRTGGSCAALAMCLFAENIDDDDDRSRVLVPFIALEGAGLIWRLDTGDDDNGTDYTARIVTKPYSPSQLQTKFEIKTASLVAKAQSGATLTVSVIPDFGTATTQEAGAVDLTPSASETDVVAFMDDLGISDMRVAQIEFEDTATPGSRWELGQLSLTLSAGQGS